MAGAALAAVALAIPWASTPASLSPGFSSVTYTYDLNGYATAQPVYLPGYYLPGSVTLGRQAPVRVFLVPAIAGLVYAVLRRDRISRRLTLWSAWSLVACSLYAVGHRQAQAATITGMAAAAVGWALVLPAGEHRRTDHGRLFGAPASRGH